ncbi:type II secretion system secretin GspD [Rahnella aquatilis]|uniref:General secretion pathway protein D n=1 Tax=Rahnella aquatilis (strain ATCC 33071 / DSM 4594 / JCM 1683 / NBRC 105701 / NCIMB 13365 / CIP 78.65) TaxID=745277 RepID=H2IRA1_RAHAC|nr:type II secretion system secretin GspD [Rahnella aquatilis]AEX50301.1 general secretion pathway protein D [Rahnella aquatilis CIP 78.65 = ATCC 33071]
MKKFINPLLVKACILCATLPWIVHAEEFTASFKGTDIKEFIDTISKNLNKTILIDPSVQGTISVRSYDVLNEEQYYQFFLSVLDVYGFAVIPMDNGLLKVVRSANAKMSGVPVADKNRPGKGDEIVTRVVTLLNVPVRELAPLLRQMNDSTGVGSVVHYEPSNVLLLTGRASVVNRLINLVERVDSMGDQQRQTIKLKYASAPEMAEMMNNLIREESKGQSSSILQAKIVADERTNTLIVSGPENVRSRAAKLVNQLDKDQSSQGNTRVFYLKYAKAEKIVPVLTGITQEMKEGKTAQPSTASNNPMSITADEQTNSIVITAQQDVMQSLEQVITKLDIRRAQVLVEAIIVEVQDGNGLNLGIQWSNNQVGGTQFTGTGAPLSTVAAGVRQYKKEGVISSDNPLSSTLQTFNGMTAGFFSGDWNVLLTALSTSNKNDILATPSIVTLDNKEASFNVGQEVPSLSGSQTTSGDNIYSSVVYKTVGTKLKVTPQINEGDSVLMEIEQEVSSVDTSTNSSLGPTFNTRTISNAVLVRTGETVVLGGLLDDSTKETKSKVPLLGDIPWIGNLFRYTSTESAKRNLMVFIRPTIIRDDEVYSSISNKKYSHFQKLQKTRQDEDHQDLLTPNTRAVLPDYPAPENSSPKTSLSTMPDNDKPRNPFSG